LRETYRVLKPGGLIAAAFIIFPAHRRKGNGRALARLAIATLKAAGCRKVLADELWHRADSLAFWKLIGFEPVFIVTELTL
jgi:GNAT superfamily N-acetyltransferase